MKIVTKSIRYSCVKHYAFCLQIDRSGSENPTIVCDSLAVSIVHSHDTHVRTVTVYITLTKQYCKINVQTNDMLTF